MQFDSERQNKYNYDIRPNSYNKSIIMNHYKQNFKCMLNVSQYLSIQKLHEGNTYRMTGEVSTQNRMYRGEACPA